MGGPSYREAKGGNVSLWEYSTRGNVQPSQRNHGSPAYKPSHKWVLGRARLHSLRKKSLLYLILGGAAVYRWLYLFLGGAAVYRCDNCIVLNEALAAEVAVFTRERLFPQPLQPCRKGPKKTRALAPERTAAYSLGAFMRWRLISLHALGTEAVSTDPAAPFCNFQLLSRQTTARRPASARHICSDA